MQPLPAPRDEAIELTSQDLREPNSSPRLILLAAVLPAGAVDLLSGPAISALPASYFGWGYLFVLGVLAGQWLILSAWMAWSLAPLWRRTAVFSIATVVICCLLTAGFGLSNYVTTLEAEPLAEQWSGFLSFLQLLPLWIVAIQIPLWTLRVLFGWRFDPGVAAEVAPHGRFTIAGMLLFTLFTAIVLSFARVATSIDFLLLGFFFIGISATTLMTVPYIAWCILPPGSLRGGLLAATGITCLPWLSITLLLLAIGWRGAALLVPLTPIGLPATLIYGAWLARLAGFEWVQSRKPPQTFHPLAARSALP